MDVEIKRWGNSQGIRIPKNILDHLKMQEGDVFELESVEQGLLLKSSAKRINRRSKITTDGQKNMASSAGSTGIIKSLPIIKADSPHF